eukprot:TRINITY_DN15865_c0_g1_i1.p2 TRINITY_DN15865_c0_g1~~TRINITY_DN15865_c0_g1_i1.p2  ORF type:complete len:106 (-),score=1.06 TRINITY_DN15865_c0_g1_i1:282-599(-)
MTYAGGRDAKEWVDGPREVLHQTTSLLINGKGSGDVPEVVSDGMAKGHLPITVARIAEIYLISAIEASPPRTHNRPHCTRRTLHAIMGNLKGLRSPTSSSQLMSF